MYKGKESKRYAAERCADLIVREDVGAPVSAEVRERMVQRIIGAIEIANVERKGGER